CPPILFNNTAYTEIYPLSLHDALPILAEKATFEETAYLLIYGDLPNAAQLKAYKNKIKKLRGLPIIAKRVLEQLPASAHPMDVLRTFVSVLGTINPEKEDHSIAGARQIADHLLASLPSALLYWHHFTQNGKRIETETEADTVG